MKTFFSSMMVLFFAICAASAQANTFIIPHIMEKSGSTTNRPFTFDTTIYATYIGGLLDGTASTATVSIYLFNDSGTPMLSKSGKCVANPVTFDLRADTRKVTLRLEDQIKAQGGFKSNVMAGFAAIVVQGDADNVNLQGFVVNSHSSFHDISVFGFEPQPVGAPR